MASLTGTRAKDGCSLMIESAMRRESVALACKGRTAIQQIAAQTASLRPTDLPEKVIFAVKLAVLDCIGVMLAGADEDVSIAIKKYACKRSEAPEATIVRE